MSRGEAYFKTKDKLYKKDYNEYGDTTTSFRSWLINNRSGRIYWKGWNDRIEIVRLNKRAREKSLRYQAIPDWPKDIKMLRLLEEL